MTSASISRLRPSFEASHRIRYSVHVFSNVSGRHFGLSQGSILVPFEEPALKRVLGCFPFHNLWLIHKPSPHDREHAGPEEPGAEPERDVFRVVEALHDQFESDPGDQDIGPRFQASVSLE